MKNEFSARNVVEQLTAPVLATVFALMVASLILIVVGERPTLLAEALSHSLFTSFGLGYTLFYTTPLIFTGLAVAIPYRAGLFNIGAEGQLTWGAIAVVVGTRFFSFLPPPLGILAGILSAMLMGAAWGGLAGWWKAKRGAHEVIVTILLNFIAAGIVDYLLLYPFADPDVQAPQSLPIPAKFALPVLSDLFAKMGLTWFATTPVNFSLFLAVTLAILCHTLMKHTPLGFEMRVVGRNPRAAAFAGISVPKLTALAMAIGGAMAGLVGVNEVMGSRHAMVEGFSPGYGFTGIAVALLARAHPIGILGTALLFGTLHNSARELEFLSDHVSKELSMMLQAVLVAVAASSGLGDWFKNRRKARLEQKAKPAGPSLPTTRGATNG